MEGLSLKNKKTKLIIAILVLIATICGLVGKIYSDTDKHYVVDVVKETAKSSDDNLQIKETIVKEAGEEYFDSKKLNYKVEITNKKESNVETQVAMVVDSSYSMETNDVNNVVKSKAIEVANGILQNVPNTRISISNNSSTKLGMTTNKANIASAINNLTTGDGNDSNIGLEKANATFTSATNSKNNVHKVILVITDSTDDVADKMKSLTDADENLAIITILVDMTSTSYINDGVPVSGQVYLLQSEVASENITDNVEILDMQKIYDQLNNAMNNITVNNIFSDEVNKYFNITDYATTKGNVTENSEKTGYDWTIDQIKVGETVTLSFSLTLKTDMDIDAGVIFNEVYTNKTQDISYVAFNDTKTQNLKGTDSREGTDSTLIKICQGYTLKIKAVNESNTSLKVEGIIFNVQATNEKGDIVCNLTKTTDSEGNITITAEEARALRSDGTITYVVTPTVNLVGYSYTEAMTFDVINDKTTRLLKFNDYGAGITPDINDSKRTVEVTLPITSEKVDLELKVQEANNEKVIISGAEFELIQPKLNSKYEMNMLTGTTDENGTLHFAPTVMTKDGTYNYILRQVTAPDGYDVTTLTLLEITFKNGKVIKIDKQFNANVTAEILKDKENHALITIGNECISKDPFDLQINLSDSKDETKLEGVTYLISTTNASNQVRKEYATTDENGQINTKIYGTGNLIVEITEQSPRVGYIADTVKKQLTIQRVDGEVKVMYMNPTLDWNQNADKTNFVINLTSEKKSEQNIVKVSLVDNEEQDVGIGSGIAYTLVDAETNKKYGPAVSDKNGQLSFTIDTKEQGQHRYSLLVDEDTVPEEYDETQIEKEINFNLVFDNSGYIIEENVTNGESVVKEDYAIVSNDTNTEYTAFITIGYQLNSDNTVEFKVQLSDKDDLSVPVQGAKYNIDIEWDINGVTRTKTITERQTNAAGQLTTRLVKGTEVRMQVKQVGAGVGHTIDITTQEIYLKFKNDGGITITQTPYDRGATNAEEPDQGAYESKGNVIYQHLNKKRSAEDTYVNLTVNKMDTNGSHVGGVLVNIKSSTLVDENGNKLDLIMETEKSGSEGTITFDYKEYLANSIGHIIRAPGIGEKAEEFVYDLNLTEMKVDKESKTGYSEKPGTTVKLRLIFRQTDGRIRLTNVETIYGNRLVKNKEFSSSSDNSEGLELEDSLGVYLSNITLDLYTNYDEVGNLSLDLKKQDKEGNELKGAEYDIRIVNPDATVVKKHVTISNGDDSSDIELAGTTVNVGSYIYITETKAPIGYGINGNSETLEVKEISDDGDIILEQIDQAYSENRLSLSKLASSVTTAGTVKSNYEVTLIDYQLDTFEFGITAVDSSTNEGIDGYQFNISTSLGAQKTLMTAGEGTGLVKVGGNAEDKTITYTITTNKVADYYKPLNSLIKVNVVFDAAGKVDIDKTKTSQIDSNYGTLWTIESLDTEGKIKIKILIDHQDPLVVRVETIDKITNAKVTDVEYKVSKSVVLPGTGSDRIEVGYVKEAGMQDYKLEQTSIKNSYAKAKDETFKVTYKDENITEVEMTSDNATITKTGDKEVTIKLIVEPKVPFEVTNLYYFDHNKALQGSNFEITEIESGDIGTGTTNTNGITGIYAGILGTNKDVMYQVRQTLGATGYATVEDFYIKATYNSDREITAAKLVDKNGNEVTDNRFVTVGFEKTSTFSTYNSNNKGIVTIQVLNYPEFKMNIENVDRRDGTTKIAGTEYSVSSKYTLSDNKEVDFISTNGVITNDNGLGVAHLDKTKDSTIVTYTITEDKPATGYQSLGTEIKVKVTFDSNGYVSNVVVEDEDNLSKIESASKVEPVEKPEDNFIVNVQLKNNPILKFNLTAEDKVNNETKIKDLGFTIVSKYNDTVYSNSSATNKVNQTDTPETSYTDVNGYTASYLDRTLDNQDMYYTIKEIQKSAGYDWIDEDIVIKVTYDSNGKISAVSAVQGGTYINIKSYDADNFEINMDIYNEEIKAFGIHLTAADTYDINKKLDKMKVESFLVEPGNTSYVSDGEYELVGDNSLLTGEDRNNDGKPDLTYGEDYKTIGQYTKGAGTRTLRLVVKNDSSKDGSKSSYYLDSSDDTKSGNNVGHYRGSKYYSDAKYQTVEYQYLINVTFDDEGKITDAKLQTGLNPYIGWLTNNSYIQTEDDGVSILHSDYRLNITMKFFPMLDLKLSAMDNYTYQSEVDKDGEPIALAGSKYTISTLRHYAGTPRQRDELVDAGYIGYGTSYGNNGALAQADFYEDTDELFVPIEKNHTRLFYVFEESEPTNYQKYTDRHLVLYEQRLVAIIQVTFNDKGEIDYDNSIVRRVDEEIIKPYMDESGNNYLSSNNIKEYNYYYNKTEANRNVNFYIGYGLTTKIQVTAIDDISNSPISNIRMYPFINDTYVTNTSYEYNTISYRTTDKEGVSSWQYWGAANRDNVNTYIIGSERTGTSYNGYYFPSDLASKTIGGSGNAEDYYAKLDITYDSNGKISNVTSAGSDTWGDNNVSDITWDSATGNIYINMLYSRKFQVRLNKVDYYDNTINALDAAFDVTSNKGLNTSINAKTMKEIGKIYKDTTVKYTLSETQVPNEYYPLSSTVDYYVTFDKNGNITKKSIKSDSDYFEVLNTTDTTERENKTSPDLTINIKNKPALILDLRVIDKFYKEDGLKNAYLKVTSSKGDVASGNPQTDSRGYANVIAGPVYPKETVSYYIEQTNTVDGYYPNATKVELQVKYNDIGKIEDYKIINGNEVINEFDGASYMNSRKISMQIMNMPNDLKIGLYKYDKTTNLPMAGVSFTITETDVNSGNENTENIITETNGAVIKTIDTFETSLSGKTIKYTIHEDETPASYRTMEDVVFLIKYNADGSINSCNQIANDNGILNEKVNLDIASDGKIRILNDERVHFKVTVPNDNAFDLVIKNKDTNYSELGIEGSKFSVSINGTTYSPELTDKNGETTVADVTESGEITINVAQNEVGEGYRNDVDNNISIKLQKGKDIYSLDLDPTTDGFEDEKIARTEKAVVEVDETYGKINVTFQNETKTELTINKQDINTKVGLKDTEFTVTAQQVDNTGNLIGNVVTLTTEDNKVTDKNGQLYFDLGVAPQSQIWKYTFNEVTPPSGYNPIAVLEMTVTYDQYGRIIKQESSKESRLRAVMADEWYNCHSMYAIIYNGDVSPAYTVKVVTEDSETGKRINGSEIYMNITDATTGELIKVEPKTDASANNGATSVTANLGIDGVKYSDEQVEAENSDVPVIVEKGLTYIDNIDFEGTFNLELSQRKTANGYVFGSQHTDGNIKIKATYVPHLDDDPTVDFTVIDNDGFNVVVDNINRIVTIKILNESKVTFNITTMQYGTDKPDKDGNVNIKYIAGVNYDITAEIQTATENIATDVRATTPLSDEKGKTTGDAGKAFAGKTVIYTLHQHVPSTYAVVEDIKIEVKYDSKGYIKYYEILTSENNVSLDTEKTKGRNIVLTVQNRKGLSGYKVNVEKHAMDTDEDEGAYGQVLPGAKFRITVHQENSGVEYTTWTDTTNDEGMINGLTFNGFGYITITLEELESPDGYEIQDMKHIRLLRDADTGEITEVDGNINFEHNEDYTEVILKPVDAQANDKYTLIINNISAATGKYITESPAEFKTVLQKQNDDGKVVYQDTTTDIYTNEKGKAVVDKLTLPQDAGDYKLTITETKASEGYKIIEEPVDLDVTFDKNTEGKTVISSVSEDYDNVSISKVSKQLIGVNIGHEVDQKIDDDEYSLDITKVDASTGAAIEPMATFKVELPDDNHTLVYAETSETLLGAGKLDYCYIEQDKDYTTRLTHMKKPTTAGTHIYKFKEVLAPIGYAKVDEELILTIEFKEDPDTGELYIAKATSSNEKYLRVNTTTPVTTDTELSIDILNEIETAEEYTIHYEANDDGEGTTVPADHKKIKGVDTAISSLEPEREGYIFKGWTLLPDSKTPQYQPGDTYSLEQNITLYAIWEKEAYNIKYEANDNGEGTIVPEDQRKEKGNDLKLSDMIPQREGYVFDGWAIEEDAKQGEYIPEDIITEDKDMTLYAVWTDKLTLRSDEYQIINAEIVETNEKLKWKKIKYDESDKYEYNEGDQFIVGILPQIGEIPEALKDLPMYAGKLGTTVEKLRNNLETNAEEVHVYQKYYDAEGNVQEREVKDEELVGTGMRLVATKGRMQKIELKTSVVGDLVSNSNTKIDADGVKVTLSGDGILKNNDQSFIAEENQRMLIKSMKSGPEFAIALDIDFSGVYDGKDKMKFIDNGAKTTTVIKSLFNW